MTAPPIYPFLPGLTYSQIKRPRWSSSVQTHTSGREVRVGFYAVPLWQFDLIYDELHDYAWGVIPSELKRLLGFYLETAGQVTGFSFQDNSDFSVAAQFVGTTKTNFLNTSGPTNPGSNVLNFSSDPRPFFSLGRAVCDLTNPAAIPPATYIQSMTATTVVLSQNVAAPGVLTYDSIAAQLPLTLGRTLGDVGYGAVGQVLEPVGYVDLSAPFNVYVNGVAQPGAAFTLDQTTPVNQLLSFTTAHLPADGSTITVDMDYFYYVRFAADTLDFEQFYHQLWTLKKVTLSSLRG